MRCILVSHTHWDREWYRTFQTFRARLVDTVDLILDHCEADPDYHFLLDGQSIVVEDYLEIRPDRRGALARACTSEQIAIGPWYIQPDSLIPSGEAHVRNLLEGRRAGEEIGPVSRVAYTPDSFGHPAQFPQLLLGFGLDSFVYWRGNGDEIADLPPEYTWVAPDGSSVTACHLARGYFAAGELPPDLDRAIVRVSELARDLAERTRTDRVLIMQGSDHTPPYAHTRALAEGVAKATGFRVERGLLEGTDGPRPEDTPEFRGELVGGRLANLLPGVWSTRTYLKLANQRCQTQLEGWAEPWAALGERHGTRDERPALRHAWRELLQNQAHDSICGCSQDAVHDQMLARYDASEGLATETTRRVLERLAGHAPERLTPWDDALSVAVFNPSPHARTDVVRLALDPIPYWIIGGDAPQAHPLMRRNRERPGFALDGAPARLVESDEPGRVQLVPHRRPRDLWFIAADVPAFGWRRFVLSRGEAAEDVCDEGREIEAGPVQVSARDDGRLDVRFGERTFRGQAEVEDLGDRGDTYDFDPVAGAIALSSVQVRRTRHRSGIQLLNVTRTFRLPASLAPDRGERSSETVDLRLEIEARVAPGVERVDLRARLDNTAHDHRLRLLFPTGGPATSFEAASTFDVATRTPGPRAGTDWIHPAPATFPQQGFVHAGGLTVAAPGLGEAEVTPKGAIAITLLRAVGWLSRHDLTTRPHHAGPAVETPGAQCTGPLEAALSLLPGLDPRAARDAELGLAAVIGAGDPSLPADHELLRLEPRALLLQALKPAERGEGCVVRLLNPTDESLEATLRLGFETRTAELVRLDETPLGETISVEERSARFSVPPRALRSILLR